MANPEPEHSQEDLLLISVEAESANVGGGSGSSNERTSLESFSTESESGSGSFVTQIEVSTKTGHDNNSKSLTSSESKIIENTQNEYEVQLLEGAKEAKRLGNASATYDNKGLKLSASTSSSSISTHYYYAERQIEVSQEGQISRIQSENTRPTSETLNEQTAQYQEASTSNSLNRDDDGEEDNDNEKVEEEDKEGEGEEGSFYEEEDTTISSEAVVDDIELILMPEMVQDLPPTDLSPQLVRVTELKRCHPTNRTRSSTTNTATSDYEADVFRDDDEDEYSDQESDFKKMGSEDEEEYNEEGENQEATSEIMTRSTTNLMQRQSRYSACDDEEPSSSRELFHLRSSKVGSGARYAAGSGSSASGKVHSGVQTEITALEISDASIPYEFNARRKSMGKSSTGTTRLLGVPGKRLNWKSELTLLPSKTKIRPGGGGFTAYESMNDQDQYSPRVAKFTSQDTLSSSSQFLKPSTLYRTRNLSRNLNQCASSESTLVLPMTGMSSESPRFRDRMSSSTSTANFKESRTAVHSYSAYQISSTAARRHPSVTTSASRNFRSSLPDLSSSSKGSQDNKGRRQIRSMKYQKSSSGSRLHKKSSSDDETSSLIDESERCLRSSIDLLLTDDLPSPGEELSSYRSTGFVSGGSAFGYYSSRRSWSQPILTDEEDSGDLRDGSMGSPFLPRKLSDMRCSRWAKVILPNGQVAVVAVKEMDELRDSLTVHTDTGCILNLPFRKVVFAWKIRR